MALLSPPSSAFDQLRAALNAPRDQVQILELPPANFLMIDGLGAPTAPAFTEAVHTLYGLTYGLRFALRKQKVPVGPLMPLEAIWRSATGEPWNPEGPHEWNWTAMIAQPPEVTRDLLREVREQVRHRRPGPALNYVRLETFYQGLVAQVLHLGPYDAERPAIDRLVTEIAELGYRPDGPHHEIYLTNPTQVEPGELRTILRQAIRRAP